MKNEITAEDRIYQACITWNIPALRGTDRDDVDHFKRTIQLLPSGFNETYNSIPKRLTPLRRAAEGLKAELTGDPGAARDHYEIVAKRTGLPGVLGTLLIAWMSEATEKDFARVERKLASLTGPGVRDVVARCHCKLATWSFDHGWVDRSHHHYEEARRHAGKSLGMALDGIGHWFGHDRTIYFEHTYDDMITFPWIDEWVDQAARTSVEKEFRNSYKSPWTRTWSLGMTTVEGTDIQSAGMQASWAGALWMVPQINRQHAALIMAKSNEPDDVARAIALWAKGGGQDIDQLVSAKEGSLTQTTIDNLLISQLHEGRSVRDRDSWLDICHALWAELPDRLVESFVRGYQGPAPDMWLHSGRGVKELRLFGKLLARSPLAVERAYSFNDWEAGLLARTLIPQLLDGLPPRLRARLLEAGLSNVVLANDDWANTGWASLVTCWTLLDAEVQATLQSSLLDALPDSDIPSAAIIAPHLVPSHRTEARLQTSLHLLSEELKDSVGGRWTGWVTHPAIDVARLALAQGSVSDSAVKRLLSVAIASTTNSEQRRSCLSALQALAEEGLVNRAQVQEAFTPVAISSVMSDDAAVDQRLDDVSRLALTVQFGYEQATAEGPLLAASRDPDTQVRRLAVSAVCRLSLEGQTSPSFDATLLGALYDPHPRVQAEAVPALWRGKFESHALLEVARARVVEIFPTAHWELRASIAHESALGDGVDPYIQILKHLASQDRSWIVRRAASGSGQ